MILAAIAGVRMWKDHGSKTPAKMPSWLALIAGMCGAATINGLFGGVASSSILGVGVVTLVAFAGGLLFWLEAVKNAGHHRIRTPVVGLLVGAALVTQFTGLQHIVEKGPANLTSIVSYQPGARR